MLPSQFKKKKKASVSFEAGFDLTDDQIVGLGLQHHTVLEDDCCNNSSSDEMPEDDKATQTKAPKKPWISMKAHIGKMTQSTLQEINHSETSAPGKAKEQLIELKSNIQDASPI